MRESTQSVQQRNTTLDLCKAISALGVVLVHFKLPGIIGELTAISMLLLFVSVNVELFGLDVSQIFKISTATLVFMLCLAKADVARPEALLRIGQRYSTVIYMAHFMIGQLIRDAMLACGASNAVIDWCLPPAALLCSVLFAVLVDEIKQMHSSDLR